MSVPVLSEAERAFAVEVAKRTELPSGGPEIVAAVAELFGCTVEDIRGESRVSRLVDARSVIVYLLRGRGWTFAQSGTVINRTDSTTQHLIERITKSLELRRLANGIAA
jgi:chromosomal replication initiation ATPase DnaA